MNRQDLLDLHYSITETCVAIMKNKNADYANEMDSLANFRSNEALGMSVMQTIASRMGDKYNRLCNIVRTGAVNVKDETLSDTIYDLINYAVLLYAASLERKD